ncbi:MAG: hypothetical protein JXA03_08730 [Bacteroidales bacterium]|nr:hypothetical protein [Bacteroidales bacterium]
MNSLVLKSNAIGQFTRVNSGTENNLSSAFFVDDYTGFVAGQKGIFLKTLDGGESWIAVNPFTVNDLKKIWFTDENSGFVVGDNNSIFTTNNGGTTWDPVVVRVDADFKDILFTSKTTAYILGVTSRGSVILKTTDKGKNWIDIPLNQSAFSSEDREMIRGNIYISSISFLDDNTGLFGGYVLTSGQEKQPFICKTADGATSFTVMNPALGSQSPHEILKIDFQSENDAYALKSITGDRSSLYAADYWINGFYPVSRIDDMNSEDKYFTSFFIDRFIGYVSAHVKGQTQILKTIDHGETFIKLNPPTQETIEGITFVNPRKGIFVGGRGLILLYNDSNNPLLSDNRDNPFEEPAFSVAVTDMSDALTDLYVYNLNVNNEEDVSVYFYNNDGIQVKILKSKTRVFNHEFRMKLKFEEILSGMYYYVIKINENTVVNGKFSASHPVVTLR